MAAIEQRTEGAVSQPDYSGQVLSAKEIARGSHRTWVGGHWDDGHGRTQLDFLQAQGLRAGHRFLDVGCGSFRAGMHFVEFLDPGNYYGVDANHSVMQAGYDLELTDDLRARLPIENLRANDRFDVDFGVPFDMAIAQSVFIHVSLNHVRLCLYRVAQAMAPGGKFYATIFEEGSTRPLDFIRDSPRAKQRFSERNVYWYYRRDLKWAASFSPWTYRYIGDWGHLAGQKMIEFTRHPDPPSVRSAPNVQAAPNSARPSKSPTQQFIQRARRWAARRIQP